MLISISRLVDRARSHLIHSKTLPAVFFTMSKYRYSSSSTKLHGEWLADVYPNTELINNQHEELAGSLLQRIQVNNLEDAEQMVDELREAFGDYERDRDELQRLTKDMKDVKNHSKVNAETLPFAETLTKSTKKIDQFHGSKLQWYELKNSIKSAKNAVSNSYDTLVNLYSKMPNVISNVLPDSMLDSGSSHLPASLSNLKPPVIRNCGEFDNFKQQHTHLQYVAGDRACLELQMADFTISYLEECKFIPVTCPSFTRQELLKQAGMVDTFQDVYTLQTKSELHATDTNPFRDAEKHRKPKFEDSLIFCVQGVCELTLMAFFIRSKCSALPIKLYSIGNQYRMPHTGKSVQSKVAIFITASASSEAANESYKSNISMVENFWKLLNINATKCLVKPYELKNHEAAAVEFVLSDTGNQTNTQTPAVLSRVSLSYDYISRRLMAYSNSPSSEFCHFTTGEMIDVHNLLDVLKSQ